MEGQAVSDASLKPKAGETLYVKFNEAPGVNPFAYYQPTVLDGDYSEDGFMALYEVAIVTKDEGGEKLVYGPKAVLTKTREAAIALASAEAGAAVLGTNPQVLVRPFATGS